MILVLKHVLTSYFDDSHTENYGCLMLFFGNVKLIFK